MPRVDCELCLCQVDTWRPHGLRVVQLSVAQKLTVQNIPRAAQLRLDSPAATALPSYIIDKMFRNLMLPRFWPLSSPTCISSERVCVGVL